MSGLSLTPILTNLREIYWDDAPMGRYQKYVDLMVAQHDEILPLEDFSPMGKRQQAFLDTLLSIDAETHVEKYLLTLSPEFPREFRVMLVILDEPKNGWTQRHLTAMNWVLKAWREPHWQKHQSPQSHQKPWIPVPLWTTDHQLRDATPDSHWVQEQVRTTCMRAHWQIAKGYPDTLEDLLRQESFVRDGEPELPLGQSELKILEQCSSSKEYGIQLASMYGDTAAKEVGYQPLGLSDLAGFRFVGSPAR